MSPVWSACRWVRKTLLSLLTGSFRLAKFAREPLPRSKTRRSRSALPTSTRMLAEAWPRVTQGLPLPSTVTRISPSSSGSSPGTNISAYSRRGVPTTGVMVIAFVPPANAGTGRDWGLPAVILHSSNLQFGIGCILWASIDFEFLSPVFFDNNHVGRYYLI